MLYALSPHDFLMLSSTARDDCSTMPPAEMTSGKKVELVGWFSRLAVVALASASLADNEHNDQRSRARTMTTASATT